MLSQKFVQNATFFTFLLFVSNLNFAQTTDTLKPEVLPINIQIQLFPTISSSGFQQRNFNSYYSFSPGFQRPANYNFQFSKENNPLFNGLSFSQNKSLQLFPNMGAYEHYNNSMIFNISDKFTVDFNFGLIKQNSVLTPDKTNLQFAFGTSLEYQINPWLSLYMYGHYLVPTGEGKKDFLDPLIYMNPLFFQSETGGGVRATYKNMKADLGLKKIYDTQFNKSNPVNSMNTKISIGF